MKHPLLPREISTRLREHIAVDDAPIFVYKPLGSTAAARIDGRMVNVKLSTSTNDEGTEEVSQSIEMSPDYLQLYCELFDSHILRIENFAFVDALVEEPFDRKNPRHLDSIPLPWKLEIAREMYGRRKNPLSDQELGN